MQECFKPNYFSLRHVNSELCLLLNCRLDSLLNSLFGGGNGYKFIHLDQTVVISNMCMWKRICHITLLVHFFVKFILGCISLFDSRIADKYLGCFYEILPKVCFFLFLAAVLITDCVFSKSSFCWLKVLAYLFVL